MIRSKIDVAGLIVEGALVWVTCVFTEKLGDDSDEGAVQCGWGYGGDEPQITIKK